MEKFVNKEEALVLTAKLGNDFTIIKNPDYVFPEYEVVPIAEKLTNVKNVTALVMDMDGTTTTTEELCLHSLEYMIRRMSRLYSKEEWIGLDHEKDFPNVIGNSTTKHVEYLITTYNNLLNPKDVFNSFIDSARWTLKFGKDHKRSEEVKLNLKQFGFGELINNLEKEFEYNNQFEELSKTDQVRIGIDIYYQRYHFILQRIMNGESSKVSEELFNDPHKHLIHPMQGIGVFLALSKGLLGDESENLFDNLAADYKIKSGKEFQGNISSIKTRLKELGIRFESNPLKIAVVTSSIYYEADIVLSEVFKVLAEEVNQLSISAEKKEKIKSAFSNYTDFYDTVVTASDSSEIRLKPHRDLYSIALHQLNVPKNKFNEVIGFEDSESGTIAIRAAGVGLCCAVPFAQTSGHNLEAASHICNGGIPEVLLTHNLFIK